MSTPYLVHAAQMFAEIVRSHADRRALLWTAGESTTFGELDRYSNQVARLLLNHGVAKRDTVCLNLEKGLLAYGAMLACLKIGAAYFFVDPGNPPARTRAMAGRCRPALALVAAGVSREPFDCTTLVASTDGRHEAFLEGISDGPIALPWTIDGGDPAYVMFTSGSTGVPKGVAISHSNLLNFIRWSRDQFQTGPADVFTNLNPLFFDNSVFDIYASLFAGAALAPFTGAMMKRPQEVLSRIDALGCTVYFSVPSLLIYFQALKLIDRASFPSLRTIVFGGEGYPKPMLNRLHDCVGRRVELVNVYGPTECTCICSSYRVSDADFSELEGYPPLGSLIPNFSYVIVDDAGQPVEAGDPGELCLGGPCVGLGYYGDPAQTALAFVQNPTHDRFFDRVYRTGDIVRYDRLNGKLHFVGRTDAQIKRQGYRIELGEIEHALAAIDGIAEAAAVYVSTEGGDRLVAVVTSTADGPLPDLRERLSRRLPAYMLPDKVVVVKELMKNANGKVDRKQIAASLAHELRTASSARLIARTGDR